MLYHNTEHLCYLQLIPAGWGATASRLSQFLLYLLKTFLGRLVSALRHLMEFDHWLVSVPSVHEMVAMVTTKPAIA